jgi:hypothetical protein
MQNGRRMPLALLTQERAQDAIPFAGPNEDWVGARPEPRTMANARPQGFRLARATRSGA